MAYFRASPVNSAELFTSKKTPNLIRLVFLLTLIPLITTCSPWQLSNYKTQTFFKANT
jgi:hypothetical protein